MKIDRTKITPEILFEMRKVLDIGGADTEYMTDDRVIDTIEKLMDAMIEFGRVIHEAVVKSTMVTMMGEFANTPTAQALQELYEFNRRTTDPM